ncbi:hypothetical protein CPB84DRAFT_1714738 [Gymnopilus junonius]|uniref:Uncharacterized protein n=1 Tax=Gymnopilus junonius TaxID=109634 RepID=A0A9P5TI48_GYMJU|nr:hypothetical protein CPB84DRAFT_1714738 [Gymnopilus junonius]
MEPAANNVDSHSEQDFQELSQDLISRVTKVYDSVRDEYSSWSYSDSEQALLSLSKPSPLPPPLPKPSTQNTALYPSEATTFGGIWEVMDYEYDKVTGCQTSKTNTYPLSITSAVDASFRPYSSYTSCAPASRNIFVGDDSHYMPFVPFSDDEAYDFSNDNELYNYFAWQKPGLDSDEQVIALETLRRLVFNQKLLPKEIDATLVLPAPSETIFSLVRKRDFPKWPSLVTNLQSIVPRNVSDSESVIKYFLDYFCTNLNCMTGFCITHDESTVKEQAPEYVPPKNPPVKVSDMATAPCGPDCFLQVASMANAIGTHWSESDKQLLSVTLRYAPDTLPCDLSVICRKPCREIYRYQIKYKYPAPLPLPPKHKQPAKLTFKDDDPSVFVPSIPCRHQGPCSADTDCECFRNHAHCRSRCSCAKACSRRTGCSCKQSRRLCGTNKCSCYKANMECDPEVCLQCKAKDVDSDLCRNVGIQRGDFKSTEVRESQYGLGLYVTEPCEERDLITEYVGEIIYEETVTSRGLHASHKGRSYVFTLNPDLCLDSSDAGNEARYINHSNTPNCLTKVLLVNGEHRLGVYANRRIAEDEELFIDYGPSFWGTEKDTTEPSAGVNGTQPELDRLMPLPPLGYVDDDPKDLTYIP